MSIQELYAALEQNQAEKYEAVEACRNASIAEADALHAEIQALHDRVAEVRASAFLKAEQVADKYDRANKELMAEILLAEAEERRKLYEKPIERNESGVVVPHHNVLMRTDLASLPVIGEMAEGILKGAGIVTFGDLLTYKDKVISLLKLSPKQWEKLAAALKV